MQYGSGWKLSKHKKGVCGSLYCLHDGTQLSRMAPVADGSPCGDRDWCIGGKCVDNGRPRIHGGWSTWSSYSSCARPCGGGVQFRSRVCKNPVPSNGGNACAGADTDWRICNSEPCEKGTKTFREEQCLGAKGAGSIPYFPRNAPTCTLWCKKGSSASTHEAVKDGTRCSNDKSNLDVCVQRICRAVIMCWILEKCMIDVESAVAMEDKCLIVKANYTNAHTVQGPENGDLIVRLPVGTVNTGFQMRKASFNYLDNGTYLVGGGRNPTVQEVKAANTVIKYTRKKAKYKDVLKIEGPTDAFLRVMYVFERGANPGLDFSFTRPIQPSDTPTKSIYEWINGTWSGCSTTCGQGVRTRSLRCVRSDDKTPASDRACGTKIPDIERCQTKPCPSAWYTTPWSDCSKSCGRGLQTRVVICRMKINPTEYGTSTNCSADDKPIVNDTRQYCNSIACLADWNTKDGITFGECGKPYKKNDLKCYRTDQFWRKSQHTKDTLPIQSQTDAPPVYHPLN
ncbi:metalloendopeptidase [Desmophyllum pertusum]|uniref:Metalloendopeptidase n=1 Tax=Desmophyllum pertusum TaxID=174260 RepID=A0A9X0A3H3_9CNID|nr:metalloendopeptidase [Desmophyllum pertusum]